MSCNGFIIATSPANVYTGRFDWPEDIELESPCIAVLDSSGNLPLTTQRYELSQGNLPFENELSRDVVISFIAYALICGPSSRLAAFSQNEDYPLRKSLVLSENSRSMSDMFDSGRLRWCATSLLRAEKLLIFGAIRDEIFSRPLEVTPPDAWLGIEKCVILPWYRFLHGRERRFALLETAEFLRRKLFSGLNTLGIKTAAGKLEIMTNRELFRSNLADDEAHYYDADPNIWRSKSDRESGAVISVAATNGFKSSVSLELMLNEMNNRLESEYGPWRTRERARLTRDKDSPQPVLYAGELKSKPVTLEPESLIAKLWNECLGPNAIPFDPIARNELILQGSKHPELSRHIEAWKKMKDAGSKWVNGGRLAEGASIET